MFKKLIALFILGCPFVAFGQLLSVTATLTDSDSTLWKNATCTVAVNSPNGAPFFGTTPVPTAPQACSVNGSGVLSTSIYNTSTITPTGATYTFSIQSATSATASTFQTAVTAANQTSNLSGLITAPRFNASVAFAYGYVDAEAIAIAPGAQYYNTTTPAGRVWTGSAWAASGGGSGGCTNNCTFTGTTIVTTLEAGDSNNLVLFGGSGGYNGVGFNGNTASPNLIGITANSSAATDSNMYLQVPSGGVFQFLIAGGLSGSITVSGFNFGSNPVPVITPSPTANAAVCVKTTGPPVILGLCSSVVGVGGACTCS